MSVPLIISIPPSLSHNNHRQAMRTLASDTSTLDLMVAGALDDDDADAAAGESKQAASGAGGTPGNAYTDPDDAEVLIELRNVTKSFGKKAVLNGASFKIRRGEAVGIIGSSGTGKSTILRIMAGLLAPDSGEVFIRGEKRDGLLSDEKNPRLKVRSWPFPNPNTVCYTSLSAPLVTFTRALW